MSPHSTGLAGALDERLVDKVGFTGSTAVGERIGELCGRHLQSPCLELGGKNPMVVTASADLALAVEGALFSGFGTAGQRCTSLGTVLVHRSRSTSEFVAALAAAVAAAPIGDPRRGGALRADAVDAVRRAVRVLSGLDRPGPPGLGLDRPSAGSPPRRRGRASSATRTPACTTTR